jgi:hypothetical protein
MIHLATTENDRRTHSGEAHRGAGEQASLILSCADERPYEHAHAKNASRAAADDARVAELTASVASSAQEVVCELHAGSVRSATCLARLVRQQPTEP